MHRDRRRDGVQTKIAQAICDEKADYVLRVKTNQGKLHQDIQDWFAYADKMQYADMQHSYAKTVNKGHGSLEIRRCWAINDPLAFEHIRNFDGWFDLHAIVRLQRERHINAKIERETAYYISSLQAKAELLLTASRYHWAVENSLHWVLDVTFREDGARGAEYGNLASIGPQHPQESRSQGDDSTPTQDRCTRHHISRKHSSPGLMQSSCILHHRDPRQTLGT